MQVDLSWFIWTTWTNIFPSRLSLFLFVGCIHIHNSLYAYLYFLCVGKQEEKKNKQICMSVAQGHTIIYACEQGRPPPPKSLMYYVTSPQILFPVLGREKSECRISPESPHQMVMFQIVFLRWARDLLYSPGAPASRDGMSNTSDRALIRRLTWLPSAATRNKVDISGSLPPEALPARFWDTQPHGGADTQGPTAGSQSWEHTQLAELRLFFFFPIPPPPDKPPLDSYGRKKNSPSFDSWETSRRP